MVRRTLQHVAVRLVGDGVDMWRHFMTLLALVQLNHFLRVDWQSLVRVHDHAKQPRVSLQQHNATQYNAQSIYTAQRHKQLLIHCSIVEISEEQRRSVTKNANKVSRSHTKSFLLTNANASHGVFFIRKITFFGDL